jgi:feruloyl-CoA synthase
VVAGHDQSAVSFLIFPNLVECKAMLNNLRKDADVEEVLAHPDLRAHVANALLALKQAASGSSTHGISAVLLSESPSIDAGEITDKCYINQRAVMKRRQDIVASLFSKNDTDVIGLPGWFEVPLQYLTEDSTRHSDRPAQYRDGVWGR